MVDYLAKGKLIFSKNSNNKYDLRFLEKTDGNRVGIRRPLKIIEKNKNVKGRRKQNELSLKIDIAVTNGSTYEIVVFDTESLSADQFTSFTENNAVLPTYLPSYSPEFWKGYSIIEPNQAIKDFTALEEN